MLATGPATGPAASTTGAKIGVETRVVLVEIVSVGTAFARGPGLSSYW